MGPLSASGRNVVLVEIILVLFGMCALLVVIREPWLAVIRVVCVVTNTLPLEHQVSESTACGEQYNVSVVMAAVGFVENSIMCQS